MIDSNWQPGQLLDEREEADIKKAYKFFQGNKTKTAQALGISIRTLDHKLEKYEGKDLPSGQVNFLQTAPRNDIQPAIKVAEEQPVPMRKRVKI